MGRAELKPPPYFLTDKIETAECGEFALFAAARDRTWVKVDIEPWEFELFDGRAGC